MGNGHLSELQARLLLVGPNLRNMFNRYIMGSEETPFYSDEYMDKCHVDNMDQIHMNANPHPSHHQQPESFTEGK